MDKLLTNIIDKIEKNVNTKQTILKHSANWCQLQSCIHFIRDTEGALETYLADISYQVPMKREKAILYIFGVLQALVVQQDAVKNLCLSLGVNYPKNAHITQTRDIRNDMGHPTDRKDMGHGKEYTCIEDVSTFADKIVLTTDYPDCGYAGSSEIGKTHIAAISLTKVIDIPELIKKQKEYFIQVLENVFETLQKDE